MAKGKVKRGVGGRRARTAQILLSAGGEVEGKA